MRWILASSRRLPSVCLTSIAVLAVVLLLPETVGAQTGTLFVEGDNVGIGIDTPAAPLHLVRTSGAVTKMLRIDNAGPARTTFRNTTAAGEWSFGHENNDRFAVNRGGTGKQEFAVAANGNILVAGSVVHSSSREVKRNFEALDPKAVLARLSDLQIAEWSYNDEPAARHIGPTAEDFYAAFELGTDDNHIAINDSAGVALVAIQGLHQLVEEKDQQVAALQARLAKKDAQLEQLAERLEALESSLEKGH